MLIAWERQVFGCSRSSRAVSRPSSIRDVQTNEPVIAKFLFTSLVSLAVTLALYETLVRPYNPVPWPFGMNPVPSPRSEREIDRTQTGDRTAAFADARNALCYQSPQVCA